MDQINEFCDLVHRHSIELVLVRQFEHGTQGRIGLVDAFETVVEHITAKYPSPIFSVSGQIREQTFPVVEYNGVRYMPSKEREDGNWVLTLPGDVQLPDNLLYKMNQRIATEIEVAIKKN